MPAFDTIVYNDIDLSGSTYGAELIVAPLPGIPQARLDTQDVPYGGGISQGEYYTPNRFVARMRIRGSSLLDLRKKLEAIGGVFDQSSDKTLIFDALGYEDRRWWARRTGVTDAQWINRRVMLATWEFEVADPIAESTMLYETDVSPDSDSYSFNIPASGTVPGSYKAYPTYIIKATGANAANIQIKNVTRDEELVYGLALPNTHWLKIETETMTVLKSTDSGSTWASVIGSTVSPFKFPLLTEGVQNSMLLTNLDNSTVEVDYRARFIGG